MQITNSIVGKQCGSCFWNIYGSNTAFPGPFWQKDSSYVLYCCRTWTLCIKHSCIFRFIHLSSYSLLLCSYSLWLSHYLYIASVFKCKFCDIHFHYFHYYFIINIRFLSLFTFYMCATVSTFEISAIHCHTSTHILSFHVIYFKSP